MFHKQILGGVVGLRDGDEAKHSGSGRSGEERSVGRVPADVLPDLTGRGGLTQPGEKEACQLGENRRRKQMAEDSCTRTQ